MNFAAQEIDRWINPVYVREFREGSLDRRRKSSPFRHAVLSDFFASRAIESLLEQASRLPVERSHRRGIAEKTDWYWGAFSSVEFIRFFLGRQMRLFLNAIMDASLVVKRKAVPQFNVFRPGSPGIPVHTDKGEEVGVVSLIQLSRGYRPGLGGELVFYRREGDKIIQDRVVAPECNTLILFQVGKESFHGVDDMSGDWTRRTISYDWLTKDMLRVPQPVPGRDQRL